PSCEILFGAAITRSECSRPTKLVMPRSANPRKRAAGSRWREHAHALLDAAESNVRGTPRTIIGLAQAVGVSRQTIWRDSELRKRVADLTEHAGRQPSKAATLARLKVENAALRMYCDKLMATFVI